MPALSAALASMTILKTDTSARHAVEGSTLLFGEQLGSKHAKNAVPARGPISAAPVASCALPTPTPLSNQDF
jgi:hypothetical protein